MHQETGAEAEEVYCVQTWDVAYIVKCSGRKQIKLILASEKMCYFVLLQKEHRAS